MIRLMTIDDYENLIDIWKQMSKGKNSGLTKVGRKKIF